MDDATRGYIARLEDMLGQVLADRAWAWQRVAQLEEEAAENEEVLEYVCAQRDEAEALLAEARAYIARLGSAAA